MFSFKRRVGNVAEHIAKEHLIAKGYKCIDTNYLAKVGELDIIMLDGDTLVFVEVRYRKSQHTYSAISSVNKVKQQKIIYTSQLYLREHPEYSQHIYRYDVVGVSGEFKYPVIEHIENAIICEVS